MKCVRAQAHTLLGPWWLVARSKIADKLRKVIDHQIRGNCPPSSSLNISFLFEKGKNIKRKSIFMYIVHSLRKKKKEIRKE